MAKHVGQFPLVGTLGSVNFYEHEIAGNIARMKPGPSREKHTGMGIERVGSPAD